MPIALETSLPGDAPASAATGFLVAVGGSAQGSLSAPADVDFIAVDLVAGQSYCFAMAGIGAARLSDPRLRLYGPDGTTELAQSAGGLVHGNVLLTHTATTTGRYYLAAESVGGTIGNYGVSASLGDMPSLDHDMLAGLIDSGAGWSPTRGTGAALTFGFAATDTQSLGGFTPFTEGQREAVRAILAQIAEVTGLSFTEVNPGGTTDEAVLLYGNYSAADGLTAQAGAPGDSAHGALSGDVWLNTAAPPSDAPLPGSADYLLLMRMICESLGLGLPGPYGHVTGTLTHAADAQIWQDSQQFTVMSAFGAETPAGPNLPDDLGGAALVPQGLGLADILALQQIYGANTATRTGDDRYGFSATAGGIYDFGENFAPMLTLWDGGGVDTLDLTGFAAAQLVRLEAGSQSSVAGHVNNLSIAYGTQIEHALGGRGSDTIIGNGLANDLRGMAGADSLSGEAGDDSLYGGAGADTLLGGAGNDLLIGEDGVPSGAAPDLIALVATNGGTAYLEQSWADFFYAPSFTLELVWQQQSSADPGLAMRFGNLEIHRAADGTGALRFDGALLEEWTGQILPATLTDGDPHRLSIRYDDGDGRLQVYLDGAKCAEVSFVPGTRSLTNAGGIWIAGHAAVGDLRIFDVPRTAQEIWDHALTALPDPLEIGALMQYWQGNGTDLVNVIPNQPPLSGMGSVSALNVSLQDTASGNRLYGGLGDDTYHVFSADDQVFEALGAGNDLVIAFADFTLGAGQAVERLQVAEGAGGIQLGGNARANRLQSSASHGDTLAGDAGNDSYHLYHALDQVIEADGAGDDTIYAYVDHQLAEGSAVESLVAVGTTALTLRGNGLANRLSSSAGFADTLIGGAGNDLYVIHHSGARVTELVGGGSDTIEAYVDYTLAGVTGIEMVTAKGTTGLVLTGNAGANNFTSNATRADTLIGGAGNDRYYLYHAGDRVVEDVGGGKDQIYAYANHTLFAGSLVEMIFAKGTAGRTLVGNELANRFTSNAAFADTLNGGAGNDLYVLYHADDSVIEAAGGGQDTIRAYADHSLASGSRVEMIVAMGNAGRSLVGNALANSFTSNATRADTMAGGAGDDRYFVNHKLDQVNEADGGGNDVIHASVSYRLAETSYIEEIRAVGAEAISLTGNAMSNLLYASLAWNDTLAGGLGDDSYYVFLPGQMVNEGSATGLDQIFAATDYALSATARVEKLIAVAGGPRQLTGNGFANELVSAAGQADTLIGGAGNDSYIVNDSADQVIESAGGGVDVIWAATDYALGEGVAVEELRVQGLTGRNLTGNSQGNILIGGQDRDTLSGGLGADSLTGGLGCDDLYGGNDTDSDHFIFVSWQDSAPGSDRDVIHDFSLGVDKINLTAIDADINSLPKDTLAFSSSGPTAHGLWQAVLSGLVLIRVDVTGDALADMEIAVMGSTALGETDFLL